MGAMASSTFRAVGFLGGRLMLSRFERTARRGITANRRTLTAILEANKDTEFGTTHRFAEIAQDPTGRAFRHTVPLSRYEDYAEAIARMERGEKGVITAEDLLFFAVSSGTTGRPKLVPTTKKHHGFTFKYMGTVVQGVISRHLHPSSSTDRGIDLMTFSGEQKYAPGGTPIGGATAEAVRRMARIVPHLWNSPIEVYTLDHQPSAWYLHALYGLHNRRNQFVEAVFASHLLEWFRSIEKRWDELLSDVEHGTIAPDLEIEDTLRARVIADNPPNPKRAEQLRAATRDGFDRVIPRIWPHMSHAMTITSGSFATYLPGLRRYLGDVPIYSPSYGATESFIGVGLWPDRPHRYVMATDPSYFEFIPADLAGQSQPSTVDMAGVETGERYELVITNHAGLYRYRLGDVVTVVERLGETPVIEFAHRLGTQFDLVGEKTSEDQLAAAIGELSKTLPSEIHDYTTAEDVEASPARYVVYVECELPNSVSIVELAETFDEKLQEANPVTSGFRQNGLLGRPRLAILAPGTFTRLRNLIAESDLPPATSQLKTPRKLTNPAQRSLMEGAVVASS